MLIHVTHGTLVVVPHAGELTLPVIYAYIHGGPMELVAAGTSPLPGRTLFAMGNEEARHLGLSPSAFRADGALLRGDLLVCARDGEELVPLTPEEATWVRLVRPEPDHLPTLVLGV